MNRDLLVRLAIKTGLYPSMMKLDNRIQMHRQNKAFAQYGIETLQQADAAATEAHCRLFLTFGTLLGAYRNKGFIPYDCDLDTGMMHSEYNDDFIPCMERAGLKHIRRYYVKATGRICEDKFDYKGVHIDVHHYYPDGEGNLYCDLCLPHESKDWRTANKTDGFPSIIRTCPDTELERTPFLGIECYRPVKTVEWLKTLYGEHFMTPDPKWSMNDHKQRAQSHGERLFRIEYQK